MAPYLIALALPRRKSPSVFPKSSLQVPSCCFIYLTNIYIARYEQPCPQHSNKHQLTGFSLGPPVVVMVIIPTLQDTCTETLRDWPNVKGLENAFQSW